jgi:glutaminyl-tRNA synthetase
VRLFERLFEDGAVEDLDEESVVGRVSPDSLVVIADAKVEPSVASDAAETRYQFERTGYFWRDPVDGVGERLVFNRIVALKDTWAKRESTVVAAPARQNGEPHEPAAPTRRAGAKAPAARAGARLEDPVLAARFERYRGELGVSEEHAELLADTTDWADFFAAGLAGYADAPPLAAWIVNDLRGLLGDRALGALRFGGLDVGSLAALVDGGAVTRRAAKDVLARMVEEGGDPATLVQEMGLSKVADPAELGVVVDAVLSSWPEKVGEYRDGKKGLIGLFVGEVMKKTGGAADPEAAKSILRSRLDVQ